VTPPVATISTPANNAVLTNVLTVSVLGAASDTNFVQYVLEYGSGSAPVAWTTIDSGTSSVPSGVLGQWVVNTQNDGTVALPQGVYVLRLRVSDQAGNVVTVPNTINLNNMTLTQVVRSVSSSAHGASGDLFNPVAGDTAAVSFTISHPATVTWTITPEQGGPMVRQYVQTFSAAGRYSLVWDGRDGTGSFVPDEAYRFVLAASDGTRQLTYDPGPGGQTGSGSGAIPPNYNAYRNEPLSLGYTLNSASRVRFEVTPSGELPFNSVNWVPHPGGPQTFTWNGRRPDGSIVSGSTDTYFDAPIRLAPASFIVTGVTSPRVYSVAQSTGYEIQAIQPTMNVVVHSFDQLTSITYRVNQAANVTVKLLPPGVLDPADPSAVVLKNNVLVPGRTDDTVEWRGYSPTDTNNILISPTQEGTWTFVIQATSTSTGATSLFRGALYLGM
jgi:hypothetical protein